MHQAFRDCAVTGVHERRRRVGQDQAWETGRTATVFSGITRPGRLVRLAVLSTRQGSGSGDAGVWALLDGLRLGVTVTRSPAIVLYGPSSSTSGGIECPLFHGVLISPSLPVRRWSLPA